MEGGNAETGWGWELLHLGSGQQETVWYLRRAAEWREDAEARQAGGGSSRTWAARDSTVPEKGSWMEGGRGGTTGGGWELPHLESKEMHSLCMHFLHRSHR
jgi:hypothetical protein